MKEASRTEVPPQLARHRVAFLTWDGPAQDYLSSLFLPIFGALVARGWQVWVYQFTTATPATIEATARAATAHGVGYRSFGVVRTLPLVTIPATLAAGAAQVAAAARTDRIDTFLPRAILPSAIARMARALLRRDRGPERIRIVFDADGFMADERAEYAGWRTTRAPYRVLRAVEAQTLRQADAVITRTHKAAAILEARAGAGFDRARIWVVPNPKDPTVFRVTTDDERRATRAQYAIADDALWLIYVGSLGPHYLPEQMLALARAVRQHRTSTRLTILTGQPEVLAPLLRPDDAAWMRIDRQPPSEVASMLGAADVGLALRAPGFSQRGVCPIKIAEYLLCGLPVVATPGVGDVEDYLAGDGFGWVRSTDDPSALASLAEAVAAHDASTHDRHRCHARGRSYFSLDDAVLRYEEALRLASGSPIYPAPHLP